MSVTFADALAELDAASRERLRRAIDDRLAAFAEPDGSLRMPARTLLAAATA